MTFIKLVYSEEKKERLASAYCFEQNKNFGTKKYRNYHNAYTTLNIQRYQSQTNEFKRFQNKSLEGKSGVLPAPSEFNQNDSILIKKKSDAECMSLGL